MVDRAEKKHLIESEDVRRQISDIAVLLGESIEETEKSIKEFESLGIVQVDVALPMGPRYALTDFGKSLGRAILKKLEEEEDAANANGE